MLSKIAHKSLACPKSCNPPSIQNCTQGMLWVVSSQLHMQLSSTGHDHCMWGGKQENQKQIGYKSVPLRNDITDYEKSDSQRSAIHLKKKNMVSAYFSFDLGH